MLKCRIRQKKKWEREKKEMVPRKGKCYSIKDHIEKEGCGEMERKEMVVRKERKNAIDYKSIEKSKGGEMEKKETGNVY